MIIGLIVMIVVGAPGDSSSERSFYYFETKSGNKVVWGSVKEFPAHPVHIEVFDPWSKTKRTQTLSMDSLDLEKTRPITRQDLDAYVIAGDKERGLIRFGGIDGPAYPEEEVELAQAARRAAGLSAKPGDEAPAAPVVVDDPPPAPVSDVDTEAAMAAPGLLVQFGPHAALAVVALVLIALIVKFTLLG